MKNILVTGGAGFIGPHLVDDPLFRGGAVRILGPQVHGPDRKPPGRQGLIAQGVRANEPVPLFPYSGSPDYTRLWGVREDRHDDYLKCCTGFSDIQESAPLPLVQVETSRTRAR